MPFGVREERYSKRERKKKKGRSIESIYLGTTVGEEGGDVVKR